MMDAFTIADRATRYADALCDVLDQQEEHAMVVLAFVAQMAARVIHVSTDMAMARDLINGGIDAALQDLQTHDKMVAAAGANTTIQ